MSYLQAVFLAMVQGLTEFLPVSSSGHLVIFQKLLGLEPPVLFDVLVHVGTLGAVVVYFRKELFKLSRQTIWLVVIGTVPAVVVGLLLQPYLVQIFDSLRSIGMALLITAGLLFLSQGFKPLNKGFKQMGWSDGVLVGLFQALAILPGVSRSGVTIAVGLSRKLKRETAFRFSFFLAIPAILGALFLQMPTLILSPCGYLGQAILGMVVAGIVGYISLKILENFLLKAKFWVFGFYCLCLGIGILLFL